MFMGFPVFGNKEVLRIPSPSNRILHGTTTLEEKKVDETKIKANGSNGVILYIHECVD